MLQSAGIASQIARGAGATSPVRVEPIRPSNHYPLGTSWSEIAMSKRVPLIRNWEQRTFDKDARVQKVQITLADVDKRVLVVRADGQRAFDYRPMTRAWVACTAVDGDKREGGAHNISARAGLEFYSPERQERLINKAVDSAIIALRSISPPAGELPVVMAAGSWGILLHEAIGHGMEADFNRKGISLFADRIGKQVAPPEVTLVDDATLPHARGSLNIDDEGSPTQRTVLVRDGTLVSYLHDRISSRHYGVPSTGSGRRQSFRHPVLPRMRSTYMESGPHDPQEVIASVKKGIYCKSFQNGQVQIGAGDFAFFVRHGYLIENGKLTEPIKDVNIIGNGPKVLESIEMVGNDLSIDEGGWTCGKDGQMVPVSQGMPTVKVGQLSVGGGRNN